MQTQHQLFASIVVSSLETDIPIGLSTLASAQGICRDGTVQDITDFVSWSVDNTSLATISNEEGNKGELFSLAVGSPLITASLGGQTASLKVKTTPAKLVCISVTSYEKNIAKGLSTRVRAMGTYSDGNIQDITQAVTWSVDNESIGSVDEEGGLHALDSGALQVTASVGGFSGSAHLSFIPSGICR